MSNLKDAEQLLKKNREASVKQYQGHIRKKWLVIAIEIVILVFVILASLSSGSSGITLSETIQALVGQADKHVSMIVWNIRMPRVLMAIFGGFGLAIAGCAFQSVLRNPLASSSTIGVAQGAAFGASVAIIVFGAGSFTAGNMTSGSTGYNNPFTVTICAFLGSIASSIVILGLSRLKNIGPEGMILTGVALSALFSGATTILQYFASDQEVASVVFWTFGDLGRVSYQELPIIIVVVLASFIYFMFNRSNYSALEIGETTAMGLGVNARFVRLASMLVGAFVSSVIVSFVGIINFIGLIAPHMLRPFVGSDYRYLLPASAFGGSLLLLLSDLVARMIIAPVILPIGAITSILGAPLFILLLVRGVNKR